MTSRQSMSSSLGPHGLWRLPLLLSGGFTAFARESILSTLRQGLLKGHLLIVEGDKSLHFGNDSDASTVTIEVKNANFWTRVYMNQHLGFSEAYMHGDFVVNSLKAVFELWISNHSSLIKLSSTWSQLSERLSSLYIWLLGQTFKNAKLNVITGYDTDNTFFRSFLSPDMTYSCAVWPESTGGVCGDLVDSWKEEDLEVAQLFKIRELLRKARLRPGDRLLEFGSGWGALAIEAAKMGCEVDTLTLSVNQKVLAEERVAALSLQDRVHIHLLDYRNLPSHFEGKFDAFICVEMVEAVGAQHLGGFFKILDWALKKDRAAVVITSTTQPESRFTVLQQDDYARRYQWPNSFCPSVTYFLQVAQSATPGAWEVDSVENLAHHYPRTLREWSRRFKSSWGDEKVMASLLQSQPHLADPRAMDFFRRKWEYLWVYAEVGYARAYTNMHHFTFIRPGFVTIPSD